VVAVLVLVASFFQRQVGVSEWIICFVNKISNVELQSTGYTALIHCMSPDTSMQLTMTSLVQMNSGTFTDNTTTV